MIHVHSHCIRSPGRGYPYSDCTMPLPCLTLEMWVTTARQSRGPDQADLEQSLVWPWSEDKGLLS